MPKDTQPPGWTISTYAAHNEAMRVSERNLETERDRRYTEVNIEKEKALKIKETADLAALQLARESQSLKELQNDALRDKTLSESGIYATNASVSSAISELKQSLQPLIDFMSASKGASKGSEVTWGKVAGTASILIAAWIALKSGTHPVLP